LQVLTPISDDDKDPIIAHTVTEFHGKGITDDEIIDFTRRYTDWNLSRKLIIDDTLAGFYLLREGSIANLLSARYYRCVPLEDLSHYTERRGVEGIILLVLPDYRGYGYGNLLKDLPRQMGYDYVYGEQFKATPDVLEHWLKRRRLIADCNGTYGDVWLTLEDFTAPHPTPSPVPSILPFSGSMPPGRGLGARRRGTRDTCISGTKDIRQ
jgi:hypothetical protein